MSDQNSGSDHPDNPVHMPRDLDTEPGQPGYLPHEPSRINPRSPRQAIQPELAPETPKRSRHVRNPMVIALNFFVSLAVLGVLFIGGGLYWGKSKFDRSGPLEKEQSVLIARGSGLDEIAGKLVNRGAITDKLIFTLGVRLHRNGSKLRAGEYILPAQASMRQVMQILVEGKSVEYSTTIPEGWTTQQIIERIKADPVLVGEVSGVPPEGSLLPETYKFTRGTTRTEMIERMKKAQKTALEEAWKRRVDDLPIKSPREMLILASIVEKETGRADERTRVASVFVNRLRKGMRLESDPTILYGLYKGEAWQRPRTLLKSELAKPNPYSTYQIKGLPPGPIANPGKAALEAVANPSRTKDLFFVADGTGGHAFAETFKEHQRNVSLWRKIERKRRAEKEKRAREVGTSGSEKKPDQ